jgi:maleylpyruvate isomerase
VKLATIRTASGSAAVRIEDDGAVDLGFRDLGTLRGRTAWATMVSWVAEGQPLLEKAAAGLSPQQLRGPSRLSGWSRGHVLTHLSRNADAPTNLLAWARTGVESRMHATPAEREGCIQAGADRALPEQLADLAASGSRFLGAAEAVPRDRRSFPLASGQGRQIPAQEVPRMRVRELWLPLVDLGAGCGIDMVPDPIAWALTRDVAAWMTRRIPATADLRVDGYGTVRLGSGDPAGTLIEGTGGCPDLPGWL